ncbi:MAG: hypothetical protein NWF10_08380 [Candidatus Bathyarchaeota archaeon]|nr:hypothetical protein [Candidatus Bathyarchaeota archaeon]
MGKNESLKKAFEMARLFDSQWFDDITTALGQSPVALGDIETIVRNAGLSKKRADWLTNYLQHYDTQYNDADTGW